MTDLIITDAGRQAAIDANNMGLTVRMTRIAVGTGQYVPTAAQTTLQTQVAVADIAAGLAIGTDQVQVSARFTAGAWDAYELGVFLFDGTLFAVGSSSMDGDFPTKEAGTDVVVTCTLLISNVPSGSVTVDASIQTTVPNATTTERGIAELADDTDSETDDERAVTPVLLKTRIDAIVTQLAGTAPAALDTIAELAAALRNNPDIVTELLAAIALRARLGGAMFTGATQGLTRAAGDDTTHFASTAFVQREIGMGVGEIIDTGFDLPVGGSASRTLSRALTDFRWIEIYYRSAKTGYEIDRIPVSDIVQGATATSSELYLLTSHPSFTDDGLIYAVNVISRRMTSLDILQSAAGGMESLNGVLYGVSSGDLYIFDIASGLETLVGSTGFSVQGLASLNGTLYGVNNSNNNLHSISTVNGTPTAIGALGVSPEALAGHAGTLYLIAYNGGAQSLYSVATANGSATLIGSLMLPESATVSLASDGADLYLVTLAGTGIYTLPNIHTVSTATGVATLLGDLLAIFRTAPAGMTFHPTPTLGSIIRTGLVSFRINRPAGGNPATTLRFFNASDAVRIAQVVGIS